MQNQKLSGNTSQSQEREILKLSELDSTTLNDLQNMFGRWFEADHCDKDDISRDH